MSYTSKCFGIFVFTFPSVQMHLYAVEYPVPPSPLVTHLFCVPHQKKSVFESLFDKGAGPMKIAKFLKTLFSQNTSGRLLLHTTKTFTIITINYFHKKHIFDVYQYLIELNKQKTPLKSLPFPTLKSMYVSMSPLH